MSKIAMLSITLLVSLSSAHGAGQKCDGALTGSSKVGKLVQVTEGPGGKFNIYDYSEALTKILPPDFRLVRANKVTVGKNTGNLLGQSPQILIETEAVEGWSSIKNKIEKLPAPEGYQWVALNRDHLATVAANDAGTAVTKSYTLVLRPKDQAKKIRKETANPTKGKVIQFRDSIPTTEEMAEAPISDQKLEELGFLRFDKEWKKMVDYDHFLAIADNPMVFAHSRNIIVTYLQANPEIVFVSVILRSKGKFSDDGNSVTGNPTDIRALQSLTSRIQDSLGRDENLFEDFNMDQSHLPLLGKNEQPSYIVNVFSVESAQAKSIEEILQVASDAISKE